MDGIKTLASAFGPKDTMDRLEAAVRTKGMTVFARIDHAAGAAEVGLGLRPTELLIFGNARAGTPLMQAKQTMAKSRSSAHAQDHARAHQAPRALPPRSSGVRAVASRGSCGRTLVRRYRQRCEGTPTF